MKISLRTNILYCMSIHRYLDFVLMLLVTLFNFKYINLKLLMAMLAVGFVSMCSIAYVGYSYDKFIQQFVLLLFSILGYDIFIRKYIRDIRGLFMFYVGFAKILSIVSFVQLFVYLIAGRDIFFFTLSTAESIRVHAWLQEPGCYATFMTPAVAFILYEKKYRKNHRITSWCILISYLFSLSAIAYFTLLLIFVQWLYVKYKKIVRALVITGISMITVVFVCANAGTMSQDDTSFDDTLIGGISGKIKQSFVVLMFFEPKYFERMNSSTYATMTNLWVAVNAPSRIFGTGLGTHEYNYTSVYTNKSYHLYGLNKEDAYSLFTRIFSEFGIVGVLIAVFALYKFYDAHDSMSKAILMYYASMLIRGGLYTMYGTILFAFIYYYIGRNPVVASKSINSK